MYIHRMCTHQLSVHTPKSFRDAGAENDCVVLAFPLHTYTPISRSPYALVSSRRKNHTKTSHTKAGICIHAYTYTRLRMFMFTYTVPAENPVCASMNVEVERAWCAYLGYVFGKEVDEHSPLLVLRHLDLDHRHILRMQHKHRKPLHPVCP